MNVKDSSSDLRLELEKIFYQYSDIINDTEILNTLSKRILISKYEAKIELTNNLIELNDIFVRKIEQNVDSNFGEGAKSVLKGRIETYKNMILFYNNSIELIKLL